jgi:uncharacterized membrane protein
MRTAILTLHVIAAIFVIGPLVALANQAARLLAGGDPALLRSQARLVTIYGWNSLVVGILGVALVRRSWDATFGEAWVVASLVMFVVATVLVLGLLAPLLRRAAGEAESGQPTGALVGRAAPVGGLASLLYLATAVLMVAHPGH